MLKNSYLCNLNKIFSNYIFYFLQIVKVHQDTADGYFEALISHAMETSAELIATDEIEELAKQWPADVEEAERILTNEEEAAELVYNFLIPEVRMYYFNV